MNNNLTSKELHNRATESAKDTRETIIKLATGAIGVLFFIATRKIKPALLPIEKNLILATIILMVSSLGSAIWTGFSDAKWSYSLAVEIDEEKNDAKRNDARRERKFWHTRKKTSENLMLVLFVLAALSGGLFVLARTF